MVTVCSGGSVWGGRALRSRAYAWHGPLSAGHGICSVCKGWGSERTGGWTAVPVNARGAAVNRGRQKGTTVLYAIVWSGNTRESEERLRVRSSFEIVTDSVLWIHTHTHTHTPLIRTYLGLDPAHMYTLCHIMYTHPRAQVRNVPHLQRLYPGAGAGECSCKFIVNYIWAE